LRPWIVTLLGSAAITLAGACREPPRAPEGPATSDPAKHAPASGEAPAASLTASGRAEPAPPGSPASGEAAEASGPSAPSGACPSGMLLVEGEYCEDLEVICEKKFHAPQNNLWVCEKVRAPTRCVGETHPKRYCIDRFEFPNREGERPMVMQNFYQAQLHCQQAGKRVCTESEWTMACEGPDRKPFPYGDGYTRDATKCHGDQTYKFPDRDKVTNRDPGELERLWQGKPSGSQPECVSDYGVHDMNGNADELAASETNSTNPRMHFDNVTTGGPWYLGVRNMCRPKIYTHDESFAYYYLSWRCCAEADGKPTDPRAPKQVARGWSFDKVEHLAHHSWKLPFNPKVPGDEGYKSAGTDR
jgi:formylglycine-generating enzyme